MSPTVLARNVTAFALSSLTALTIFVLMQNRFARGADSHVAYPSPRPTGVLLEPVGDAVDLGSVPLGMTLSPDGNYIAIVLSGWREQGLQVIDLGARKVTQTLAQPAAFLGVVFARDGKHLLVSG